MIQIDPLIMCQYLGELELLISLDLAYFRSLAALDQWQAWDLYL